MNPDPINQAEEILRQEAAKVSEEQSTAHKETQPFLHAEARRLVTLNNRNHFFCHLFIIKEADQDEQVDSTLNPFSIPDDQAITAGFHLTHSFQTRESALKAFFDPRAMIVINEMKKAKECAVYLYTQSELAIMLAGHKVTVTQRNPDRQYTINHATMTDDHPETFFANFPNDEEKQLIMAVMALFHGGAQLEHDKPNQYNLVLERMGNAFKDFLGNPDDQ